MHEVEAAECKWIQYGAMNKVWKQIMDTSIKFYEILSKSVFYHCISC